MKKILGTVALVGTLLGTTASAGGMCSYYINSATKNAEKALMYFTDLQDEQSACLYHKQYLMDLVNATAECPQEDKQDLKKILTQATGDNKRLCK